MANPDWFPKLPFKPLKHPLDEGKTIYDDQECFAAFMEYAKSQFSDENILFLQAMEKLEKDICSTPPLSKEAAISRLKDIYLQFIPNNAPNPITQSSEGEKVWIPFKKATAPKTPANAPIEIDFVGGKTKDGNVSIFEKSVKATTDNIGDIYTRFQTSSQYAKYLAKRKTAVQATPSTGETARAPEPSIAPKTDSVKASTVIPMSPAKPLAQAPAVSNVQPHPAATTVHTTPTQRSNPEAQATPATTTNAKPKKVILSDLSSAFATLTKKKPSTANSQLLGKPVATVEKVAAPPLTLPRPPVPPTPHHLPPPPLSSEKIRALKASAQAPSTLPRRAPSQANSPAKRNIEPKWTHLLETLKLYIQLERDVLAIDAEKTGGGTLQLSRGETVKGAKLNELVKFRGQLKKIDITNTDPNALKKVVSKAFDGIKDISVKKDIFNKFKDAFTKVGVDLPEPEPGKAPKIRSSTKNLPLIKK